MRKLVRSGSVYQRAKASWIYDLYWRMANRQIIDDRLKELVFYRSLLGGFQTGDFIVDIGANQGYKADIFLRLGARVLAVEPDENSAEILKQRFLKFRFRKKPITVVTKAVSDSISTERFWIDTPGSAKNTLSQKWAETLRTDDKRFGEKLDFEHWKDVQTVTVDELIANHGAPFFIKIDVEGHELGVLRGLHRPVPYLSFEVNLPEFRVEGIQCVQTLETIFPAGRFNYVADCRVGLVLSEWLASREFSKVVESCTDESIEVFWRT